MKVIVWVAVLIVVFVLGWQAAATHNGLVRLFFSSPRDLANYGPANLHFLLASTYTTMLEAAGGLLLALIIAGVAGTLVSLRPSLISWVLPPMILSQVIPLITIAPLLLVIFGIGMKSKMIMAAIIAFFPVFVNIIISIRDVPRGFMELMTLYKPRWSFRVRYIYLPLSLPGLMAALRISATLSVIGAVVAEFTGAELGLGKNLFLAARRLEPELMMSSVFLTCGIGLFLYLIVVVLEQLTGYWYLRK